MGKQRLGILSLLTTKGTLPKKRGQPRIDIGIEFVIYSKLLQISKGRNISMWKAWGHELVRVKQVWTLRCNVPDSYS